MINSQPMLKADLVSIYGTFDAIGALFTPVNEGVPLTKSAVSQWGEEIPELRAYQLRELVPDIDAKIAALRPTKRERVRARA